MKRTILSLILLAAVLLASCGEAAATAVSGETEAAGGAVTEETEAAEEETGRAAQKDSLPDDLDFEGYTMRFLHRTGDENVAIEVDVEETGEVVNAAIHDRTLYLEERFNIGITEVPANNNIHGGDVLNPIVRKSVAAGSDDFDIIFSHMSQSTPLGAEGLLFDLNKLDYLDFTRPWWYDTFMREAELSGHLFFAAGDLCLTLVQSMYMFYYNRALYESYFDGSMYDVVYGGGWTMDKLVEMGETVYSDLNGDGKADEKDRFGYVTNNVRYVDALLVGADVTLAKKDSDGVPYFSYIDDERTYTFIEKLNDIFTNERVCHYWDTEADEITQTFAAGNALFLCGTPMMASLLREMTDDFGVIPVPKLDETQEEYTTCTHNGFSTAFLPVTCTVPDEAAAVMEAMSAESYRTVTPAYYETALKVKYSRDDETSRMLDEILASVKYNFGYIYAGSLNDVMQQFRKYVVTGRDSAASTMASTLPKCQAKLDELLETYASMS